MRLGEEDLAVHREQHLLVDVVRDARDEDFGIRHAALLRIDSFLPKPEVLLAVDEEAEVVGALDRAWERERDTPDVALGRHGATLGRDHHWKKTSRSRGQNRRMTLPMMRSYG